MEHAEHAEHASGSNKKIALLIAVIALFLALSETLGKGRADRAISKNVEASNLWRSFQAKSIRRTVVQATSEHAKLSLVVRLTPPRKRRCKSRSTTGQDSPRANRSEPENRRGLEELANAPSMPSTSGRGDRKVSSLRNRLAAFQIGIVLASATIITGMIILAGVQPHWRWSELSSPCSACTRRICCTLH